MRHGRLVAAALLASSVFAACGSDPRADETPDAGGTTEPDGGDTTPDAGEPDGGSQPATFCEGATAIVYDPVNKRAGLFPDDFWAVEDASTRTGVKLDIRPGTNFDVPSALARFQSIYADLSKLDGFGVNGAITVRVDGELDAASIGEGGAGSGNKDAAVVLVRVHDDRVELLDVELQVQAESSSDRKATIVASPLFPLVPKARYAFVVTNRARAADDTCLAPSAAMKSLLDGSATDAKLTRLVPRYADLVTKLEAAGVVAGVTEISSAVVFTTQSIEEESTTVATDIRTRVPTWTQGTCTEEADYLECEGSFVANDYRADRKYLGDGTPKMTGTLPVTVYLPKTGTAPFPTMIYGHGLGGDRHQAAMLAEGAAPLGYAVVAVDAPKHGDHPDKATNRNYGAFELFGVNPSAIFLGGNLLDGIRGRDNLRQAAFDKLQLVELVKAGLDANGDDTVDLDANKLVYVGVSLGGIMGPQFLTYAPEVKVAAGVVPGSRLADIIRDAPNFQQALNAARGTATDGDIARLFPAIQSVLDAGDPGSFGRHVIHERLPGFDGTKPQFLMQMVLNDDIVPNSANRNFARALGLPLAGDELQPIAGIGRITALPASGNLAASLTGGVYQFDIIDSGSTATHNNTPGSRVAFTQVGRFVQSYFADGKSEIIDSYRVLGVK